MYRKCIGSDPTAARLDFALYEVAGEWESRSGSPRVRIYRNPGRRGGGFYVEVSYKDGTRFSRPVRTAPVGDGCQAGIRQPYLSSPNGLSQVTTRPIGLPSLQLKVLKAKAKSMPRIPFSILLPVSSMKEAHKNADVAAIPCLSDCPAGRSSRVPLPPG